MSSVRRSHRRRSHPETTLDYDDQSELTVKVRYGVGLELLVGEALAEVSRTRGVQSARMPVRTPAPHPEPRPDARARAAALGVAAGARGRWLSR